MLRSEWPEHLVSPKNRINIVFENSKKKVFALNVAELEISRVICQFLSDLPVLSKESIPVTTTLLNNSLFRFLFKRADLIEELIPLDVIVDDVKLDRLRVDVAVGNHPVDDEPLHHVAEVGRALDRIVRDVEFRELRDADERVQVKFPDFVAC